VQDTALARKKGKGEDETWVSEGGHRAKRELFLINEEGMRWSSEVSRNLTERRRMGQYPTQESIKHVVDRARAGKVSEKKA